MTPKKITDAAALKIPWLAPEYSTSNCFNVDGSLLLLLAFDHFQLFTSAGEFIRDLPIVASQEPRWSTSNPKVIYYLSLEHIMAWTVGGKVADTVHEFKEYESVSGYGEMDCVDDCLVLGGKRKDGTVDVFAYDCGRKLKSPVIKTDGRFNGLYLVNPLQVVITWNQDTGRGIEAVHLSTAATVKIAQILSHQCVCRWDGEDYLVWANSPSPDNKEPWVNGIEKIRIRDGKRELIAKFEERYAMHLSPANLGWVIVETYNSDGRDDGSISKLYLDGRLEKLLDHHSIVQGDNAYDEQPKAVVSRDGRKLVYGSNMGGPVVDTYLVELEEGKPNPVQVDVSDDGLELIQVRAGAEFVLVARHDSTFDVYERMASGVLAKVQYPADGVHYPFISYQGGLRMFRKR